ncbi:hypothetical protein GFY24_22895 [Nocardia sp. SYP-A9097]|uniref:hypothetical protein n=1 Tax=Nocardia sp. SYP-A9097 TaxID=2663237 RepID=UPI00129AFA9A|nr:hypothetical protein [Nocardia sp. SYP-A9097]MRH90250.1 hypothetical protein [Nocardia sp. SYP-A9097]
MNRTGLVSAAGVVHSVIRVVLSLTMIGFGMVKVIPTQFIVFTLPGEMLVPLGESSSSGMLWKFMATSTPYTVITGAVEVIGGLLLIFRRTVLLGALVCMVALIQVSILNIAYDVPVIAPPLLMLAMALAVSVPWWSGLIDVLFRNRDSAALPPPRADRRRIRLVGTAAHSVAAVLVVLFMGANGIRTYYDYTERLSPLDGVWAVDEFHGDGPRWVRFAIDDRPASQRLVLVRDDGELTTRDLTVATTESVLRVGGWTLRYTQLSDTGLHLIGQFDGGPIDTTLRRIPLRTETRDFR